MEEEITNEEEENGNPCEECGLYHTDSWEAMACWSSKNDPNYDPWDI